MAIRAPDGANNDDDENDAGGDFHFMVETQHKFGSLLPSLLDS